ncbi:hypothetical protein KIF53_13345 [Chromobacterium subtsugae]|uniref:Lipoprotein n=1 Tax=Chromobacterium subtsugae TaxID=251747 RepID=A0ABS7FEV1_9NEIS|nr:MULTISPECIES: hypothetical protein [Chromobacterium]KUM03516.1 hypothetical protein Cv017_19295 [Chromobacterium subtsugae]KZE87565.1 hypothetical protein AWB61_10275 [Chromobacterium sp. F49]MBW7567067.1 hypothetical protein [Chromobacterium subtsugae]MBW8288614.1 hypothetical protein [Chromobacterium subtsugae]WSE90159.1 hypothetical protein U6115_14815 [Chromobacterium subtsugae]
MFSVTNPLLPTALSAALCSVALGCAGYGCYGLGQGQTTRVYEAKMAKQEAAHAAELLQKAEKQNQALAAANAEQTRLTDLAHKVGWQLLQTQGQLARSQAQLRERIADATRNDGQAWTGLGPDSLRLYRASLGYSERDPGLPAADAGNAGEADQAGAAARGLPPADLLNHAADYGRWCQELETRLDGFIRLHQEADHG